MKKQFLFLAFFTLALIFAGTNAFGQNPVTDIDVLGGAASYCPPALPLACGVADGLTPMPGVSYPYTITSSSVGKIHWLVTDEANIVTAVNTIGAAIEPADGTSPYILDADVAYNDPANTSLTVNITWKSFDGAANAVILVVYNVDDQNCTDNMEVYRIVPQYAFTLDIAGIAEDGATGGAAVEECVNPIQTASYDGATNTLNVDYGTDYVFFAVNAANWMTSWMPDDFTASVDAGSGSTATVDGWAYPDDADDAAATWKTVGTDPVLASAYATNDNGFIGKDGACIIVRVKVDHLAATENIADETVNLIVNGQMASPIDGAYGAYPDLTDGAAGAACGNDLTTDNANYLITPRPAVAATVPTPFETKVPTGN